MKNSKISLRPTPNGMMPVEKRTTLTDHEIAALLVEVVSGQLTAAEAKEIHRQINAERR